MLVYNVAFGGCIQLYAGVHSCMHLRHLTSNHFPRFAKVITLMFLTFATMTHNSPDMVSHA